MRHPFRHHDHSTLSASLRLTLTHLAHRYIRDREQYGNLTYPTLKARDAFMRLQATLSANLTVTHLSAYGPSAYQRAVDAARADNRVKAAFAALFADAPVPPGRKVEVHDALVHALVQALMLRYTNQGARQHCALWRQLLQTAKKGVAIRTKLKVEAEKVTKETLKQQAAVAFEPSMSLGRMDAENMHALLKVVAATDAKQLAKCNLAQLRQLFRAYGDSRYTNAKAEDRASMVTDLAALIKSKHALVAYDRNAFKGGAKKRKRKTESGATGSGTEQK